MKSIALAFVAATFVLSGAPTNGQTTMRGHSGHEVHGCSVRGCSSGLSAVRCIAQPQVFYGNACPNCPGTFADSRYSVWADAVRAAGEYQRSIAAAEIDWATARRMAIDNWAYGIRQRQEIRHEAVARELAEHPRLTPEQQREITRMRDPKRLPVSQLSSQGIIAWPSTLEAAEFSAARSRLDDLFAERARGLSSSAAAENVRRIDESARELLAALANCGDRTSISEQVSARNFVGALRFEARQPLADVATTQQVAVQTDR
jgi:hypothetical protein